MNKDLDREPLGTIFNIQHFSTEDGPGIRSTVFMKGCPLSCWWCHNPEGLRIHREIIWYEEKCIGCQDCLNSCEAKAILTSEKGFLRDKTRCQVCGACVEACPAGAREMVGRVYSVSEVLEDLDKDRVFYEQSGGGITVSGGEPLLQPRFVRSLLARCREAGFHTALDTSGQAPWPFLESMLEYADLILFDLKHPDPASHLKYCGVDLSFIHENLNKVGHSGRPIWIRIPIIPGINDELEILQALAQLIQTVDRVERIDLLPYHPLGRDKYRRLDLTYRLPEIKPPSAETLESAKRIFTDYRLPVR